MALPNHDPIDHPAHLAMYEMRDAVLDSPEDLGGLSPTEAMAVNVAGLAVSSAEGVEHEDSRRATIDRTRDHLRALDGSKVRVDTSDLSSDTGTFTYVKRRAGSH